MPQLTLFNSLTRTLEPFEPIDPADVRLYTCGPTVYNHQHIGNMRAFLFADTLGRTLRWKGYPTTHVINITDVGHLTSDADAGEDKMERAAGEQGRSIWDIAAYYTAAFKRDVARLNIMEPALWSVATDHVAEMIAFAERIEANGSAYRLPGGLYFDVKTVPDYGGLARLGTDAGENDAAGRIATVEEKRQAADFALWRSSAPDEHRQMEWDSPWGRGAPGWHLECSAMSRRYLGHPFDIHTGGIDHREIHHPNEIAQNQAYCGCGDPGARVWMHNNFLVERSAKMSKSTGQFTTLQTLVDRGVHPLAYRLMCLSAHYRSELEFSFEGLAAALTRLKRLTMAATKWLVGGDATGGSAVPHLDRLDAAISDDLNTPMALVAIDDLLLDATVAHAERGPALAAFDLVLGLDLLGTTRADLRIAPADAAISDNAIETRLAERRDARAARDFIRSDAIRDALGDMGVEVMDGDPLGWDWRLAL